MERYDITIIGGGSGGLTAARTAAALGARVLLIDKEQLGGDKDRAVLAILRRTLEEKKKLGQ